MQSLILTCLAIKVSCELSEQKKKVAALAASEISRPFAASRELLGFLGKSLRVFYRSACLFKVHHDIIYSVCARVCVCACVRVLLLMPHTDGPRSRIKKRSDRE